MTQTPPNPIKSTPPDGDRLLTVDPAKANNRLDVFLADGLGESRAQVRRLLGRGLIRLDGRVMRESDKGVLLTLGQRVEVAGYLTRGHEQAIPQPDMPLQILAEGPGWLAVSKPAGVPVHPLEPDETGTLLGAIIARYPAIHGVGEGGLRSGVVHRLDIETSGVVLFATEQSTWLTARDAFRLHTTRKSYLAIVLGSPPKTGRASLDLVVAQHRPARVRVVEPDGNRSGSTAGIRRCDLSWRVIESLKGASLVEVDLGTGFLHQIRVMMSHLGHPVAGDAWYASPGIPDATGATRPMLHACRLELPSLGIVATCDPPADFLDVQKACAL